MSLPPEGRHFDKPVARPAAKVRERTNKAKRRDKAVTLTAAMLSRRGVPEKHWAEAVEKFGPAPDCGGCDARKEWAAEIDKWIKSLSE